MFRNPTTDVILVIVVLLLFFGPKRLPEMGRSLGKGMREFKNSITGKDEDDMPHTVELTAAAEEKHVPAAARERDTVG